MGSAYIGIGGLVTASHTVQLRFCSAHVQRWNVCALAAVQASCSRAAKLTHAVQ